MVAQCDIGGVDVFCVGQEEEFAYRACEGLIDQGISIGGGGGGGKRGKERQGRDKSRVYRNEEEVEEEMRSMDSRCVRAWAIFDMVVRRVYV